MMNTNVYVHSLQNDFPQQDINIASVINLLQIIQESSLGFCCSSLSCCTLSYTMSKVYQAQFKTLYLSTALGTNWPLGTLGQ